MLHILLLGLVTIWVIRKRKQLAEVGFALALTFVAAIVLDLLK